MFSVYAVLEYLGSKMDNLGTSKIIYVLGTSRSHFARFVEKPQGNFRFHKQFYNICAAEICRFPHIASSETDRFIWYVNKLESNW